MKPTKKSHIEFCQAVADGSTYKEAYKTYVSRKDNVSVAVCEKDGSLLGTRYATHIAELKERTANAILDAHDSDVTKEALKRILTVAEVDAILSKMIKGEDPRAVDIYYKRFGHYAPTKIAPTNKDGENLEQKLSEEQVDKILDEIRANKSK